MHRPWDEPVCGLRLIPLLPDLLAIGRTPGLISGGSVVSTRVLVDECSDHGRKPRDGCRDVMRADAPLRILYVEACEDGTVGGSHQALFDLVRQLDRCRYEPVVLFYEKNRWVAQSLFKAFTESQRMTYEDLYVTAALKGMLPWLTAHVEDARALMGDDYWPYGVDANRKTLETFLRHHHSQGLSPRLVTPEEMFHPGTLESFKI